MEAQQHEPTCRLFFALWPDQAMRDAMVRATRKAAPAAGRPVPASNLHVTLAFLGSVPERRLGELREVARASAASPGGRLELTFDHLEYWRAARLLCAQSLLDLAAEGSQPEVVRLLLAHGAHARGRPDEQVDVNPLAVAMVNLADRIHDPHVINPFTGARETAAGSVAIIRLLLDAGADPNAPLSQGYDELSPLGSLMLIPRFDGDLVLARLLVQHGARVDGTDAAHSPLVLAIERGNQDYAQLFLDSGKFSATGLNDPLAAAAGAQNGLLMQELVAAGADPDTRWADRPMLCRILLFNQQRTTALALVAHGANVNADCGIGQTPLTLADDADHQVIDMLVSRGGRLGVPDTDRADLVTHGLYPGPLTWAVVHHHDYAAARLLARNPQWAQAECGLVIYAAASGAKFTLAELFRQGADPNASTASGVTALMVAAYHGDVGALQVLVSQPGIDINRATSWQFDREFFTPPLEGGQPPLRYGSRTALMFAALGGSVGATELLLHHGAYAHERDAEGWQAADFARNGGVVAALSAR
ncbi:MAG TPA: ankyrin repeat domain-containing protein [Steroidobacteraceae bacterium]